MKHTPHMNRMLAISTSTGSRNRTMPAKKNSTEQPVNSTPICLVVSKAPPSIAWSLSLCLALLLLLLSVRSFRRGLIDARLALFVRQLRPGGCV